MRDRAIIETLYATGMRVSELVNLKKRDLIKSENVIRVFGKGSKERIVPIGDIALEWIERYDSSVRNEVDTQAKSGGNDFLFLNFRGGKLSRISVWRMLQKYARDAKYKKTNSPAHFEAHFCDASLRRRRRHSRSAGDAGTQRHRHDTDIFALRQELFERSYRQVSSKRKICSVNYTFYRFCFSR